MKHDRKMLKKYVLLLTVFLLITGCDKDNDNDIIIDPEGTMVLELSPCGNFCDNDLMGLCINDGTSNVVTGLTWYDGKLNHMKFAKIGEVAGVGDIKNIPMSGWEQDAVLEPGCGYVVWLDDTTYCRMYVEDWIHNNSKDGTTGAKIKYQMPFKPTIIKASESSLSIPVGGYYQFLVHIETNAKDWKYESPEEWIKLSHIENTILVSVDKNESIFGRTGTVIVRANEQIIRIPVIQAPIVQSSAPYAIGDLYYENGVIGVVYKVSDYGNHGMIASLTSKESRWTTTETFDGHYFGCSSRINGMENMEKIKQIENWSELFPAFKWCDDLNTGGVTGWYMPAIEELKDLYVGYNNMNEYMVDYNAHIVYSTEREKFNEVLINNEGNPILKGESHRTGYWLVSPYHLSSTEGEADKLSDYHVYRASWLVEFDSGYMNNICFPCAHGSSFVRAVRAF